jgi:hypothetical protein
MGNNSSTETKACVVMEPSLRGSVRFTRAWLKLAEFVPEYADQTIAPTSLPIDSFRTNLWDVTEDLHREFGILAYDGCERTQAWDIPFTAILEAAIGSPTDDRIARANVRRTPLHRKRSDQYRLSIACSGRSRTLTRRI